MASIDYKNLMDEAQDMNGWRKHKFMILVLSAIVIAIFMVMVAMNLYSSSGTAQLDLSRPDYQSVRAQAGRDGEATDFSAVGPINKSVADEFRSIYQEKANQVIKADGFSGEAMSDAALGLPPLAKP